MVLALHNPDEMGTGRYDLKVDMATPQSKVKGALETPGAPKKKKSERPNPDLETATVNDNVKIQGLGDMKDEDSWRDDKATGIRYDMYSTEATKKLLHEDKRFQPRTKEEREKFEKEYNPDEETEGIWFGGISKTRRRKKANKKTKKNKRQTKKQPKKKNKKTLKVSKTKKN